MIINTRMTARALRVLASCLLALCGLSPFATRADTVASLLGNFTINQYCGLRVGGEAMTVHYVVVFGQLPALRELHVADADGNGSTSQAERDAYVGRLAPTFAKALALRVDGVAVPLEATRWTSSLPTEQGGFSLRIDVDFAAALPGAASGAPRKLEFSNQNYPGRMGWHEIVVTPADGVSVFDTNAFGTSLTGGLNDALQSLPADGPLDERTIHLSFDPAGAPHPGMLAGRSGSTSGAPASAPTAGAANSRVDAMGESAWITRHTRELIETISAPQLEPRVIVLALLGALFLGAVHALSPGHGKTIVGAYLIGSRGTPRHAAFLGLTVTVTHTLGVFVLGFATLYASRFIVPERLFPILSLVSAVLVLGMGLVLLVQRARAARTDSRTEFQPVRPVAASAGSRGLIFAPLAHGAQAGMGSHAGMHSHGGGPMHSHLPPGSDGEKITWRSLLTLGVSSGLVPCPSAMVLLLAAVALNKTAYGMLLVVAFSVGLAITLTVIGLAFLYARNRFQGTGREPRWTKVLPVLSAATITLLGAALFVAALRSFA